MSDPSQPPVDAQVIDQAMAAARSRAGAAGAGQGNGPPQVIVIQQPATPQGWGRRFGWFGWLLVLFGLPLALSLFGSRQDYLNSSEGLQERFVSGDASAQNKIAVIDVSGVITDGDGIVKRQINRVRKDPHVKAVVVRINSPGGTVTGSDFIHHHLTRLRDERQLKLVVSMGGVAASGGYYIAMAVGDQPDSIYAEPTTTTGSIGVIIPHYDLSGLLSRLDVKEDSLVSHPRKKLLSMTTAMSDDHREVLSGYLDQAFERFKSIVRQGRPKLRDNDEALTKVATGEIFAAPLAQELGLVDRIGFVEDAVARAAELAGLDPEKARVVRYESPLTIMSALGLEARQPAPGNWQALLEITTPRAFYLASMLPGFFPQK